MKNQQNARILRDICQKNTFSRILGPIPGSKAESERTRPQHQGTSQARSQQRIEFGVFSPKNLPSGGNSFKDFPENQLAEFCALNSKLNSTQV